MRFGDFTLKSGKKSDIFLDFGLLYRGKDLARLGQFFAEALHAHGLDQVDALYGPPYKGISIATATALALHFRLNRNIPVAYSRKEAKQHGEAGRYVGADLAQARSAVILDDVFTDGGTKYETLDQLRAFPQLQVKAVVVGVDRQEVGPDGRPHVQVFTEKTGVPVRALTTKDAVRALARR